MRIRWILLTFVLLSTTPVFAMTDAQRSLVVDHAGKLRKLTELGSKPVGELLGDKQLKAFFDNYARVLKTVEIAGKIADGKDREALQAVAEEIVKNELKEYLPDVYKAMSWFTWAKKGMELFKDFVFDPWLISEQIETYAARRAEGASPAEAFESNLGWGYTRERALAQLEREGVNMKLLWVDGERGHLSPAWERALERFVIASFERAYARMQLLEAGSRAREELTALDRQLVELVEQRSKAHAIPTCPRNYICEPR